MMMIIYFCEMVALSMSLHVSKKVSSISPLNKEKIHLKKIKIRQSK